MGAPLILRSMGAQLGALASRRHLFFPCRRPTGSAGVLAGISSSRAGAQLGALASRRHLFFPCRRATGSAGVLAGIFSSRAIRHEPHGGRSARGNGVPLLSLSPYSVFRGPWFVTVTVRSLISTCGFRHSCVMRHLSCVICHLSVRVPSPSPRGTRARRAYRDRFRDRDSRCGHCHRARA